MKLIYKELGIELTRRCNERCKHCLRGPAEPVDLSKDVIDALFDNKLANYNEIWNDIKKII